jgi:hypothetical protein
MVSVLHVCPLMLQMIVFVAGTPRLFQTDPAGTYSEWKVHDSLFLPSDPILRGGQLDRTLSEDDPRVHGEKLPGSPMSVVDMIVLSLINVQDDCSAEDAIKLAVQVWLWFIQ